MMNNKTKHISQLLIVTLLVMLLFASCNKTKTDPQTAPTATPTGAAATETPEGFAALYEKGFADNVYSIDGLIREGGWISEVQYYENYILVLENITDDENGNVWFEEEMYDVKSYVITYDISTAEIVAQFEVENADKNVELLDNGKVVIWDHYTHEADVYDFYGNVLHHIDGVDEDSASYTMTYVDYDGQILWRIMSDTNEVYGLSLTGGEDKYFKLDVDGTAEYFANKGELLYLRVYSDDADPAVYALNINDGALIKTDSINGCGISPSGDAAYYKGMGNTVLIAPLDDSDSVTVLGTVGDNEYILDDENGVLLTTCFDDGTAVRAYDVAASSMKDEFAYVCDKDSSFFIRAVTVTDQGFAVVSVADDIKGEFIYIWDYEDNPEETQIETKRLSWDGLEETTDEIAAQITETYGIEIKYDENSTYDSADYTGEKLTAPCVIYSAMTELADFCTKFPDEMFEEMCIYPITHIEIYLCGTLEAQTSAGISYAGALSSVDGGARVIVADIGDYGTFEQNLSHEFMHVMEDRIWASCEYPARCYQDYWETLVPEDQSYYYSYHDPDGNELRDPSYTAYDENAYENPDVVWFVDAYSKASPLEDRARIFEYLFASETKLPAYFESKNLMYKAQYLCAVIRECFPSAVAQDELYWERYIEKMPYSYFEEAVSAVGKELYA